MQTGKHISFLWRKRDDHSEISWHTMMVVKCFSPTGNHCARARVDKRRYKGYNEK